MDNHTRWQQRHDSFTRALSLLEEGVTSDPSALSMLEKEGVVHRFEYTFDLAWKTLKDYLQAQGVDLRPVAPRQVLKQALIAEALQEGQVWMDMLEDRVRASHQSNEAGLAEVARTIHELYLPAMQALQLWLDGQRPE